MTESNSLELNVAASTFDLVDIFGRRTNLQDYRGKKVLIAFFRHAGCPFCNLRVHRLQKNLDALKEAGLEMIFFFESEQKVLLSNNFHKNVSPIPLISDPEKTTYNAYGIENSASKSAISHLTSFFQTVVKAKIEKLPVHLMAGKESINTIPAEFLIDEMGMVKKMHYAKRLNDEMSLESIFEFAKK